MRKVRKLIGDALYWVSEKIENLASWIYPPFKPSEYDLEVREELRRKFGSLRPFDDLFEDK